MAPIGLAPTYPTCLWVVRGLLLTWCWEEVAWLPLVAIPNPVDIYLGWKCAASGNSSGLLWLQCESCYPVYLEWRGTASGRSSGPPLVAILESWYIHCDGGTVSCQFLREMAFSTWCFGMERRCLRLFQWVSIGCRSLPGIILCDRIYKNMESVQYGPKALLRSQVGTHASM